MYNINLSILFFLQYMQFLYFILASLNERKQNQCESVQRQLFNLHFDFQYQAESQKFTKVINFCYQKYFKSMINTSLFFIYRYYMYFCYFFTLLFNRITGEEHFT